MQLSVFHFSRFVLVVLVSFCISACASSGYPPPLEASKLELAIVASDAVNPDEKGRSSPILVRVYELKNDAVFQESDFFTLQKQDKLTLGSDLLTKDDFIHFCPVFVKFLYLRHIIIDCSFRIQK